MKWKLTLGILLLFSGFASVIGIGLILLYMLDEYKKIEISKVPPNTDTYISPSVVEEFR